MAEDKIIRIPVPIVAPLGQEVEPDDIRMVWDAFVKPTQMAGEPQSMEMRILMAVLRAVNAGLDPNSTWTPPAEE